MTATMHRWFAALAAGVVLAAVTANAQGTAADCNKGREGLVGQVSDTP